MVPPWTENLEKGEKETRKEEETKKEKERKS